MLEPKEESIETDNNEDEAGNLDDSEIKTEESEDDEMETFEDPEQKQKKTGVSFFLTFLFENT